jgi:DNA-binding NtrC family response regulator
MTAGNGDDEKQILVITSDSGLLLVLKYLLLADGFGVVVKSGVKNIVNSIDRTNPELILLDLHASTGDAVRTLYAIRKLNPHLPVLLLVESEFLPLAESLTTDVNRHILRNPIDYEQLRNHLRLSLTDSTNFKTSKFTAGDPGFLAETSSN